MGFFICCLTWIFREPNVSGLCAKRLHSVDRIGIADEPSPCVVGLTSRDFDRIHRERFRPGYVPFRMHQGDLARLNHLLDVVDERGFLPASRANSAFNACVPLATSPVCFTNTASESYKLSADSRSLSAMACWNRRQISLGSFAGMRFLAFATLSYSTALLDVMQLGNSLELLYGQTMSIEAALSSWLATRGEPDQPRLIE
jgi:hypothetical protein